MLAFFVAHRRLTPAITRRAFALACIAELASELTEKGFVDFICLYRCETQFEILEHFDELLTINEFYCGNPIARRFATCSAVKVPVVMMIPLSARPAIAPRKSRTCEGETDFE